LKLICEKRDVQDSIIKYLQSVGWKFLPAIEALNLRNSDIKEPFLIPIVKEKLKQLNRGIITEKNVDEEMKKIKLLPSTLRGNEEFLKYLRNQKTVYVEVEKRERNIKLIDYENPENNDFAFTEGFWFEDRDKRQADKILFINGFPIGIMENKSPTLEEAEEVAFGQIKVYTNGIPELLKYIQFYAIANGIRLHYGPTWNYETKTFYRWKTENHFNFEKLTKSFFDKGEMLNTLKDYVVFLTIDDEIHKYILVPHQRRAIRKMVRRILREKKTKGLIWHTQGAYKTLTMMVTAKELREAPELENPTIIAVVDRIELEDQISKNFQAYGFPSITVARNKDHLRELLASDYRGLIITIIHKFAGIPKNTNKRSNIIVLIDEAHRSQEGDLGIYMRAALPNAYYFGFTGTPIDKGRVGQGTFVTFGYPPEDPYLDKYFIDESIEDKTTVPLYYTLTKTDFHVDKDTLENEFFKVVEEEGVASIEGVNRIIKKAKKTKAILKGTKRINTVAKNILEHYLNFVEPSGFKGFIVAVDREACAMYKETLNKYLKERGLPEDYARVVYTPDHNDEELLRKYWLSEDEEKIVRRKFRSPKEFPKILIVTEKLLTGYDAPILYAMYLDKPLKDHTLLQAIARVNRPYEGKTCGLIVDYIGLFDNLKRALSFDEKDIGQGLVNIDVLKTRFQELIKRADEVLGKLNLADEQNRLANIIDYFFDEKKRSEFIRLFKETERIYEVLSPDEFLRDYIRQYKHIVQVYEIIYNTYNPEAERKRLQREILRKTEALIEEEVELRSIVDYLPIYEINQKTAALVKADKASEKVKIVNLNRSLTDYIQRRAKKEPYLLSISEEVEKAVGRLKELQTTAEETLNDLTRIAEKIATSEDEQRKSGLNKTEFSIFWILENSEVKKPETITRQICNELNKNKEWIYNEQTERTLRKNLYKILIKLTPEKQLVELVNNLLKIHSVILEGQNDE
jgi:type I restriction enzyme R subunit